jgi:hypothetical protein
MHIPPPSKPEKLPFCPLRSEERTREAIQKDHAKLQAMFARRGDDPIKIGDLHQYYPAFPQLAVLQCVLAYPKIYGLSDKWSWEHSNGELTLYLKRFPAPLQS